MGHPDLDGLSQDRQLRVAASLAAPRWTHRLMFALPNPDYESLPRYQEFLKRVDDSIRKDAMSQFLPVFYEYYKRQLNMPTLGYDVRIGPGDDILRRLQEDGCALARIDPELKARLVAMTKAVAEEHHAYFDRTARARFKHSQRQFDPVADAELFQLTEEALRAAHVYDAANAYAGSPLKLKTLAVQVNTVRGTSMNWGELDEAGLPSPKTRYLHIDSAMWPPLKVLIYLNPVTHDQGPFRYVVGSHRVATEFELVVRKTNDKAKIRDELFMALPPPFRMYTDFGDDIDPGGEAATALLRDEREYCDGVSDVVLFDFNGVHRGGFVRQGHRYLLQCGFGGGG